MNSFRIGANFSILITSKKGCIPFNKTFTKIWVKKLISFCPRGYGTRSACQVEKYHFIPHSDILKITMEYSWKIMDI